RRHPGRHRGVPLPARRPGGGRRGRHAAAALGGGQRAAVRAPRLCPAACGTGALSDGDAGPGPGRTAAGTRMLTLSEIRARYGLPSDSGVLAALAAGQTLPAPLYWAPEVHQLEQEKVFARSWQYACHESRLARPGDTVLAAAGGIPLVITCGAGG